ncbi:MAG: PH domain-containing protein [Sphaerimonospora mesophila]
MAKMEFDGQFPDEKLLFVFRRHIIAMRKGFYGLLLPFCLGAIPFFIWQSNVYLLWGPVIGFGLGLVIFFYHWIGWYFSVYIVTDQRIRQSSQKNLFGRSVIDLGLEKIQNISYNVPGFTGEFLGFGTIVLQTMVGDMVINKVAHCEQVYNQLSDAIHRAGGGTHVDSYEEENG